VVQAFRRYGDLMGVAYQIYDDCLDLVGTEGSAGKTLGTDLARGKLTLPLLHMLEQLRDEELEEAHEVVLHGTEQDRLGLLKIVVDHGGLRRAVRQIQELLQQACREVTVVPDNAARRALREIAELLGEHVAGLSG
jgi:octaprenyl-diphosphate synthase